MQGRYTCLFEFTNAIIAPVVRYHSIRACRLAALALLRPHRENGRTRYRPRLLLAAREKHSGDLRGERHLIGAGRRFLGNYVDGALPAA